MPYHIMKTIGGYYVIGKDDKHFSNHPLPLSRAKRQLTALEIAYAKEKGMIK